MSKFNEYARRVDEYAKGVFKEYTDAEAKLKSAENKCKEYPRKNGLGYGYTAKAVRYEAEYAEARAEYENLRRDMRDYKVDGLNLIRRELEAAISDDFAANPEHLDMATMELIRSGILSANEYSRLMDKAIKADNHTMVRVLSQYASNRATEATQANDKNSAHEFRVVASKGSGVNGHEYIEAFDVMTDCFKRCMGNTSLIKHWDELVGGIVERF